MNISSSLVIQVVYRYLSTSVYDYNVASSCVTKQVNYSGFLEPAKHSHVKNVHKSKEKFRSQFSNWVRLSDLPPLSLALDPQCTLKSTVLFVHPSLFNVPQNSDYKSKICNIWKSPSWNHTRKASWISFKWTLYRRSKSYTRSCPFCIGTGGQSG